MCQPEKRAFELACVAMLGALADLEALADRGESISPMLPPRSMQIQAQNLKKEIEALYERVFILQSDAAYAECDAELAALGREPLTAEAFDHFPPFEGKPQ